MSALPRVTDATYEAEVLNSKIPVLVDFTAEWCGPCRSLGPILDALAKDYAGKVKFVQVDIDESRQTPSNYQIMAVPTLILIKDGKPVDRVTGFKPKGTLVQHLDKLIA
jgi:thioredoxin 1